MNFYLAQDTSLERKVALKFLPEVLQQDEIAPQRFPREARSAAAIDHPFICKIYEIGQAEERSLIAMEYGEGKTLEARLKKERLSYREVLRIGSEIAEALQRAHQSGIIHRDLKPSKGTKPSQRDGLFPKKDETFPKGRIVSEK